MKKYINIIVIILSIIGIIILGMYTIDMYRMKNNKPVLFGTWGYDYIVPANLPGDEINFAIMNYILENGDNEKYLENAKTFASIKIYLIEEKQKDKLYYIYAWVLEEKYYLENNEIKQDSGSSIPHKFIVSNIDNKFVVTDSIIPRDGSYYDDMKKIFPKSVFENIEEIYEDGTIQKLQTDIQKQVKEYFNK